MHKVFIDGQAGTTGLQIHQLLAQRSDIEVLQIAARDRKKDSAKADLVREADVVILCLPDAAAAKAVQLLSNFDAKILDASTAHRVNRLWTYGLPELCPDQRSKIASSQCVSNPGCYATGFLPLVRPLVSAEILPKDSLVTIQGISGYSGGGKSLIGSYEQRTDDMPKNLWHVRPYSLGLSHKHLPEMTYYAGLDHTPLFSPAVGHFHQGMLVQVPLFRDQLRAGTTLEMLHQVYCQYFENEACINVHGVNEECLLDEGFLDPQGSNGSNRLDIFVFGNEERFLLVARLDNLGKGAAGAAVQNLNLMLGQEELTGLGV